MRLTINEQTDKEVAMLKPYKKQDPEANTDSARIVRIETMLYLLCMHLGLDPRTGTTMSKPNDRGNHNKLAAGA